MPRKASDRYLKLVEWSEEDACYVGRVPGLFYGGCHGDDERQVYAELCAITEDVIQGFHERGKTLPPPTIDFGIADKIRAWSDGRAIHAPR